MSPCTCSGGIPSALMTAGRVIDVVTVSTSLSASPRTVTVVLATGTQYKAGSQSIVVVLRIRTCVWYKSARSWSKLTLPLDRRCPSDTNLSADGDLNGCVNLDELS